MITCRWRLTFRFKICHRGSRVNSLHILTVNLPPQRTFQWRVLLTYVVLYFLGNLAGIPLLHATPAPIAHFAYDAVVSAGLLKVYLLADGLIWAGFLSILVLAAWMAWKAIGQNGRAIRRS
jgi:hypothetical protein